MSVEDGITARCALSILAGFAVNAWTLLARVARPGAALMPWPRCGRGRLGPVERREFNHPKNERGAVRTVLYFFNAEGDPVDDFVAARCHQVQLDQAGNEVWSAWSDVAVTPFPRSEDRGP